MFMLEAAFNKEMLILLREANGWTQKDLANLLGFKQSRISKFETGDLKPHPHDILWFAQRLKVEKDFFHQEGEAHLSSVSFYRKRMTLPLKVLNQSNAQVQLYRLNLEKQIGNRHLGNQTLLPYLPPEENGGPLVVANKIRKLWNVPNGPIGNLIGLLENAGCIVVNFPFPSEKIDGLCIRSNSRRIPIIFINEHFSKSRRRLSLAHELGHLVMHTHLHEKVEEQAWEFASEFLMPSKEIKDSFNSVDIAVLGKLKCQWGVSMQALLQQGKKLKKINESQHRYLWIQLAKCGYRKNEPFEEAISDEKPTVLEKRLQDCPLNKYLSVDH